MGYVLQGNLMYTPKVGAFDRLIKSQDSGSIAEKASLY